MGEIKNINKKGNIWHYVVFLFAFVFVSFAFNFINVGAKSLNVSIPSDSEFNYDNGLPFYVGYDVNTVHTIKYKLNGGDWISLSPSSGTTYKDSAADNLCENTSYVSCNDVIIGYKISNLPIPSANTNYNGDKKGTFTFEVYGSNIKSILFIKTGDEDSASATYTYDRSAPSVSKVTISRNDTLNKNLKTGDVVKFGVELSEASFSKNVSLSFKIGEKQKTASCNALENNSGNVINCYYTVARRDLGAISSIVLTGANNIKDVYNNYVSSQNISVSDVINSKNITVDGFNPFVMSIVATSGVFSSLANPQVKVTFNENIVSSANYKAPVLLVKFGEGIVKECTYLSGIGSEIIYSCLVGDDDQGVMTFVSYSGENTFTDTVGNELDLSVLPDIDLSNAEANNDLPDVALVSVKSEGCINYENGMYCKKDASIAISFTFNMHVEFNSKNIRILFGGNNAKNSFSQSYDATKHELIVNYSISNEDDGQFSLEYKFNLTGANSLVRNVESAKEFNYYIDNKKPEIGNLEIYFENERVTENVIYGGRNKKVVFKFKINDASFVQVDRSKIYLTNGLGSKIAVGSDKDISNLNVDVVNDEIVIEFSANKNFIKTIRIKIEKSAIKDYFGNELEFDYVSESLELDTLAPVFGVNVSYPMYKGYNDNGTWFLISGKVISFSLNSEDVDLKDYCVVNSLEEICLEYKPLTLNTTYEFEFKNESTQTHSFYIKVRDAGLNESIESVEFKLKNIFSYSSDLNSTNNNHSIVVDVSMFENGTDFKYGWFKKGAGISFNNANVTRKDADSITVESINSYNGEYNVCINRLSDNVILCSEYVNFDVSIDKFEVNLDENWTNQSVNTSLVFNDASTIKCVAVGKDFSDLNCNSNNENVVIYKTSQAISPLNKYVINENGIYYFYIEDAIGNSKKISKTISNIDKDIINIEVFNGNSNNYDTNLEIDMYKASHKILLTFDKDINLGSPHITYKYFFSLASYTISNVDTFNSYYLKNTHHGESAANNKKLTIITPAYNGIYNLYVMAIDTANNVSFKEVNGIKVDSSGPKITMYNSNNVATNGGSASYIITFDYNIVIEDYDSKLDLNTVYYRWIDLSNNQTVVEKKYTSCSFDYNMCKILGENIEFGTELFDPRKSYKFELSAKDLANNMSTFTTSSFKIDTTSPNITININEEEWHNNSSVSFVVSKENNSGTLDSIGYCLNDCLDQEKYDLSKFVYLGVNNPTVDSKTINLLLNQGENNLYLYARDVFGNYSYKNIVVKYDDVVSDVVVNNVNSDGIVDLSDNGADIVKFVISEETSGVKKYCIYLDEDSKDCRNINNLKEIDVEYEVTLNGSYYIEVIDNANNVYVYNVNVMGIDTEPISFDLVSSLTGNKFTNDKAVISVVNMRKFMVDDVSDRVSKIEYVKLSNGTVIEDYDSLFNENVIVIYDKLSNDDLITNFEVDNNGIYVVKITDTAENVSYNQYVVTGIDKDSPIIDTNTYGDGTDRIYVNTSSGVNIREYSDGTNTVYKYSNDVLKIYFGANSLKDLSTGFNDYLGLKICFDEGHECVYNTYHVENILDDSYLVNKALNISAPYNFSGTIRYYLVDAALNSSDTYTFNVVYQSEVGDIQINVKDENDNSLIENRKYNKIKVGFNSSEIEEIIDNNGVKYVLKTSNVNMYNEFANRSQSINEFLNNQGFVNFNSSSDEIALNNVDGNYYLWVFVVDLLNNYKLIKADELIRMDTIKPLFSELGISVDKIDSSNYDLVVKNKMAGYKLYIDTNNDTVFEEVVLTNNKYSFTVSGVSNVSLKVVDEANNETIDSFSLSSTNNLYARAYQIDNTRRANVVIYNLGGRNVTSFRYILTNLNNNTVFDNNSIDDDSIAVCSGYEDVCKSDSYSVKGTGVYEIALSSDKRVVFYIYVDGNLVYDYAGNILEEKIFIDTNAPVVTFENTNPILISTKNNNYTFNVSVSDDNINNSNNYKYVLTTNANIDNSNFDSYYNSCNGTTCIKGVFSDSIEINGGSTHVKNLTSGKYYFYVYAMDDYGNASVTKSAFVNIDNASPVISYSIKDSFDAYSNYIVINNDVFVGGASKIRFSDDNEVNYFEVYSASALISKCYVDTNVGDFDCDKTSGGEIGFVKEGNYVYYYLDNGNYRIVAYDKVNNVQEVNVNIDNRNPSINLFKKIDESYELQNSSRKVFNSLNDLYVNVIDDNFNYLTIDLENTYNGEVIRTAVRYSYNSDIGRCLSDSSVCLYGKELKSMLSGGALSYNKITINVYDKANRLNVMEISYDDDIPVIWTMNVNESVYIDGVLYTIKENMLVNIEIGVNRGLTLDKLLNKLILEVDGYSYDEIKDNALFEVKVYQNSSLYVGDLINNIGTYKIEISYRDIAGNVAETKIINVVVSDNVKPTLEIVGANSSLEIKEETTIYGVIVRDNYGLEVLAGNMILKEKIIDLLHASCSFTVSGLISDCNNYIDVVSKDVYKFTASGEYKFVYTISDLSGNIDSVTQIIYVGDNKGPVMSSDDLTTRTIEIGNRNVDSSINSVNVTFRYPVSYDNGDESSKIVSYVGLFAINNMGEKYKVNDDYKVSDTGSALVYKFTKVGTYYLRFSSSDSSNNISMFEYEIKVVDLIAPTINAGVLTQGDVVEVKLEDDFSVEECIIEKYTVTASDNYDSNVKVYYEIKTNDRYTHEVVLKVSDSSGNESTLSIYVNIVDKEAPIVGTLQVVSSTNLRVLEFVIVGGEDNSNRFKHMYSISNGEWLEYTTESKLEFSENLSNNMKVCIKAVDFASNESEITCKDVLVDTRLPMVNGVNDGDVLSEQVSINVVDDRLASVTVIHNDQSFDIISFPYTASEIGLYSIIARDTLGNERVVNFMIDIDIYMNVTNDLNSEESGITSIEFDRRSLIKAHIDYDNSGNSNISIDLRNISINSSDMVYVLGVVPGTDTAFVMFSDNGTNIRNNNEIRKIIGEGNKFKEGVNNEDCFLKFNDEYYAYVIIMENVYNEPVIVDGENTTNKKDDSALLSTVLIVIGAMVTLFVGYQIIKFRKRVRAA